MKLYDDKHIKTIALVGAHHSGKTTLSETMLFEAGLLNRRGSVEEKIQFPTFTISKKKGKLPFLLHPFTQNGEITK